MMLVQAALLALVIAGGQLPKSHVKTEKFVTQIPEKMDLKPDQIIKKHVKPVPKTFF